MDINVNEFKKYNIILLCGLYGAGKTKFANMNFKNTGRYRISRSEIRRLMYQMTNFGEPWTSDLFTEDDDILVKHVERKITEHYLHNKRNIIVINTFITKNSRERFIKQAKNMKKTISVIFLDTPLEKCRMQSEEGPIIVPEIVLNTLHMKRELPTKKDGFDDVLIINDF